MQWTHTLKMKPMLLIARRQALQHPLLEHHVVLTTCGLFNSSCAALLAEAAPLVENVTCNTPTQVVASLPGFSSLERIFSSKSKFARPKELEVGATRWCWNSCDSPYLLWYARTGAHLKHVRFFWFAEWDVVWTGDAASIFTSWNNLPTTTFDPLTDVLAPPDATASEQRQKYESGSDHDLLCANPSWANYHWVHRGKRDPFLVYSNVTFRCVTGLFRLTPRLLSSMVAFSRHNRSAMFCEMRAASVCAMETSWCKMRTFFDDERARLLYTYPYRTPTNMSHILRLRAAKSKWVGTYSRDGGVLDSSLTNLNESMIYHAYKWSPSSNVTATQDSFEQGLVRAGLLT